MTRRLTGALLGLALGTPAAHAGSALVEWRLAGGRTLADPGAPRAALRVGSLQKPFVARAWAEAHPGAPTPRHDCRGGDACWLRGGHGPLGLVRATAASCNVYFRGLARDTPAALLARVLREEGFLLAASVSPDAAIGLEAPGAEPVGITAQALLRAYSRLVREPWSSGENVRAELLAGLRAAALDGTARGLDRLGPYAKTGTAPSVDGRPLTTSGLAIVVDGAGSARLGMLPRGTGREAAAALAAAAPRPASPAWAASERVRLDLFSLLKPRRVVARNVSGSPLRCAGGWVGPGGERDLVPGERLEQGLWELRLAERGLVRRLLGAIEVGGREDGRLTLVAELDPFEYVSGVAAAELLPSADRTRLVALGAAALRFLAGGPRHAQAHVCDSTHCAFFVGRGPRVAWPAAGRALFLAGGDALAPLPLLDSDLWAAIRAEALRPGPEAWTSHCGGAPLSARFVWGGGSAETASCPRHGATSAREWTRVWPARDAEAAFGPGLRALRVDDSGGTWRLRAEAATGAREWLYDDAHRALARVLGWGALPSPADSVEAGPTGFRAEGRGLGHRVGLCLAD